MNTFSLLCWVSSLFVSYIQPGLLGFDLMYHDFSEMSFLSKSKWPSTLDKR